MNHVHRHAGFRSRARALALLAVLVGACNGTDNLTNSSVTESTLGVVTDTAALDSVATDSGTVDSLALDTLVLDSLALDSIALDTTAVAQLTPSAVMAEAAMYSRRGTAFGPSGLWAGYTAIHKVPVRFSASTNFTDANGIVKQINTARAMGHRLVLNMTGGKHERYKTRGKFDFGKWKARMNTYNRREIKAAVARGVADGTIIMNTMMDEPNVKSWGGVMTKPLLDQMARYAKAMFPTLPVAVALRWDWRQHEKFRVVDTYLTQYGWNKGPINQWRENALAQARSQGMKVMFAMNILDGGQLNYKSWTCPSGKTGGRGTYRPTCRMTAGQVREWGRILGTSGCGLIMWKYDRAFMSKAANVSAFRDLASTLARTPGRSCRRGS